MNIHLMRSVARCVPQPSFPATDSSVAGGASSEHSLYCASAPENPEPLPEGGVCLLCTCVQLSQMLTLDQQFTSTKSLDAKLVQEWTEFLKTFHRVWTGRVSFPKGLNLYMSDPEALSSSQFFYAGAHLVSPPSDRRHGIVDETLTPRSRPY
ncbi:hypothetical protein T05_15176 [Trichinella murrelli]|uniref:Uncharacterized protein n=1 Tax=Trichinella murrelli TaxID=144512 RepID=A0A0V0SYR3_9BILA|nr:hypothetical protein T05_15176 [Trichinella murrelli]